MVDAHNAKVARGQKNLRGEADRQRNDSAVAVRSAREILPAPTTLNITKAEPKKKALLNKTESLWKAELERRGHKIILVQALTLRLGDRLNYRPDLVTIDGDFSGFIKNQMIKVTCYETKAPHRFAEKGIVKVKAAAKQFPFIRFVLVMRKGGQWTEREIGSE